MTHDCAWCYTIHTIQGSFHYIPNLPGLSWMHAVKAFRLACKLMSTINGLHSGYPMTHRPRKMQQPGRGQVALKQARRLSDFAGGSASLWQFPGHP